jgi:hypothetical protein
MVDDDVIPKIAARESGPQPSVQIVGERQKNAGQGNDPK